MKTLAVSMLLSIAVACANCATAVDWQNPQDVADRSSVDYDSVGKIATFTSPRIRRTDWSVVWGRHAVDLEEDRGLDDLWYSARLRAWERIDVLDPDPVLPDAQLYVELRHGSDWFYRALGSARDEFGRQYGVIDIHSEVNCACTAGQTFPWHKACCRYRETLGVNIPMERLREFANDPQGQQFELIGRTVSAVIPLPPGMIAGFLLSIDQSRARRMETLRAELKKQGIDCQADIPDCLRERWSR